MLFNICLITSCKSVNLDVRLLDIVKDTCVCNDKRCECNDIYTDDYVYIDCSNFEVRKSDFGVQDSEEIVSFTDVIKYCDYGNIINGYNWDCYKDFGNRMSELGGYNETKELNSRENQSTV